MDRVYRITDTHACSSSAISPTQDTPDKILYQGSFHLKLWSVQNSIQTTIQKCKRTKLYQHKIPLKVSNIFQIPHPIKHRFIKSLSKTEKKYLHWPGIKPSPPAWKARILPLNHQCHTVTGTREKHQFIKYFRSHEIM